MIDCDFFVAHFASIASHFSLFHPFRSMNVYRYYCAFLLLSFLYKSTRTQGKLKNRNGNRKEDEEMDCIATNILITNFKIISSKIYIHYFRHLKRSHSFIGSFPLLFEKHFIHFILSSILFGCLTK